MVSRRCGYLLGAIVLSFYNCGSRKAIIEKTDLKIIDKKEIISYSPGFSAEIAIPMVERPRSERRIYKTKDGLKTSVDFNDQSMVTNISTDCPPVKERIIEVKVTDDNSKRKESERDSSKSKWWIFLIGFLLGVLFWAIKPWKNMLSINKILKISQKK